MSWTGRTLVPGGVTAPVLLLDEPLSFWGGMDPHDGRVIDRNHPQHRSVLAEAIRLGTAPAALVLGEPDAVIALGALAAAELYGVHVPIVVVAGWAELPSGGTVTVEAAELGGPATITARSDGASTARPDGA